jgi:phosphoglycolate phosphatase (TIGR01487 family)
LCIYVLGLLYINEISEDTADLDLVKAFAIDIDGTLTEDGEGMVHLSAISSLRHAETLGCRVIFVTGRSSVEAYMLSVFSGTTKVAVGENGGAVTIGPQQHIVFANRDRCIEGYEILKKNIDGVTLKPTFNRITEVVLCRTFDIKQGQRILEDNKLNLYLTDSKYAFHINEKGIDKSVGLKRALRILDIDPAYVVAIGDSETDIPMFNMCGYSIALNHAENNVKASAQHVVSGRQGEGAIEAIEFSIFTFLSGSVNSI